MRRIGAAIGGAVAITFLWYFFNEWVDNAGIAFVRGQGWPLSTAWLTVAGGAIGGVVRDSLRRRGEVQQSSMAVTTADDLGLAYTPAVGRPAARLPCFERWSRGKDGNTGEIGGVPVSVFDMTECVPSDEGNSYPSRTVVLLPVAGPPEFTATPRWLGGRFAHAFGFGAMTFDPSAAPADDAEVVRRFGRAVRIEAPGDPGPLEPATAETHARETAVRRLFSPALMAALLDHPGWSFQADGEWLACWRGNEVRPAGERPEMMADAGAIRAALLAAVADSSPVGLPPLPLPTSGQYRARLLGTVAGAAIGLFGGFFGGFFGGGAAAFGLKLFAVVPLLAAAVGVVPGGVFGYVIGAAIGRLPAVARWTPPPEDTPEQKAEKRRRARWQQGCGCLGLFAGFPAGSAVFVALDELAWGGNVKGGWIAMVPILCFGGAITGWVCGSVLGGRLARRRETGDAKPGSKSGG